MMLNYLKALFYGNSSLNEETKPIEEKVIKNYLKSMFYNYLFMHKKLKTTIRDLSQYTYQVVVESDSREVAFRPVTTERDIKDSYYAQLNLFSDDLLIKPSCNNLHNKLSYETTPKVILKMTEKL